MALMRIGNSVAALVVNIGGVFVMSGKTDEFVAAFGAGEQACKEVVWRGGTMGIGKWCVS